MKIVLATTNPGKIAEIKAILALPQVDWLTWAESADWPHVAEDGATFLANAEKKAAALAAFFNLAALADDSGLEVDVLGGRPGILSARFAGPQGKDADNVAKLLSELEGKPEAQRGARFVAEVVLARPDGRTISARGVCAGSIALEARGQSGFGYDPVFIPKGHDKTMAELGAKAKNRLSHRGAALRALRDRLVAELGIVGAGSNGS